MMVFGKVKGIKYLKKNPDRFPSGFIVLEAKLLTSQI